MSRGVIVLAPPWPRSGSSNLFAAQAAAHAQRGARVFLLLTPLGRGFCHSRTAAWEDALASMQYAGIETVAHPHAGRGRVRAYLQWLLAGRDDTIAIVARYGAAGRMPDELKRFLASAHVDLIHANHVVSMPLAERVAGLVHLAQGQRPRILLDTHDIQSNACATRQKKNPLSRSMDTCEALVRTVLALCRQADALVHFTEANREFFAGHLPELRHEVVPPTIDPASETELVRRRTLHRPTRPGFVYIGNQREGNLATVAWLLREVLPLAGSGVTDRVRIVGSVGALLRRRDPELYRRYAPLFVGEVPSILDVYADAHALLAPATAGTGTSIKLIEALCAGKPVLTTRLALRGIPAGEAIGAGLQVHDTAADFAEAMTRLAGEAGSAPPLSLANAAIYDRLFSNARYFAALDDLMNGRQRLRPTATGPDGPAQTA